MREEMFPTLKVSSQEINLILLAEEMVKNMGEKFKGLGEQLMEKNNQLKTSFKKIDMLNIKN